MPSLRGVTVGLGVLSRSIGILLFGRTLGEGSLRVLASDFLSLTSGVGLIGGEAGKIGGLCVRVCGLDATGDLVAAIIRSMRVRSFISTTSL